MKHPARIQWITFSFLLVVALTLPQARGEPQNPAAESVAVDGETSTDVEVGLVNEHVTNGFAPWRSQYLQLTSRIAARKVVYGRIERADRYSQRDFGITTGGYYPLGERWTAVGELNASPNHNFLAAWSALGQIDHDFGGGWAGHAGMRYRKYDVTHVGTGNFGVEKALKRFRLGYTLYASSVADAGTAITNRFDGSYNYGNSVVSLTFASGKELENIVPSGVLSTNVRLINLSGAHWFAKSWAASYSLNWHNQGNIYTRQGLTLGLRYRL